MSRRTVLVDICNTLADINSEIERMTGVARIAGQYRHPSVCPEWFLEHLEVFANAPVIRGSVEYIHRIAVQYDVLYVTARPQESESVTREWLRRNGFPDAPIIFTNNKVASTRGLDIAFAIDDAPEEIEAYTRAGIFTLIPAWDYNEGYMSRFVYGKRGQAVC